MQAAVFYAGVGLMLYKKYQQMQLASTIDGVEKAEQEQQELNEPDEFLPSSVIQKAKKNIDGGTCYNEVNTDLDSMQTAEIQREFAAREAIKPAFESGPQPEGVYLEMVNRW